MVELATGDDTTDAAATEGFVPASGGVSDTQGFVPASGGGAAAGTEPAAAPDLTCRGSVSRGADPGCGRRSVRENYWTSRTSL